MGILKDFLIGLALIGVASLVISFLGRIFDSKPLVSVESEEANADQLERGPYSGILYFVFLAVLVGSPAFSFFLVDKMQLDEASANAATYIFIAIGVVISLPLTLMIARGLGERHYWAYWRYLEDSSRVSRRTIAMTWVGVIALTLGVSLLIYLN